VAQDTARCKVGKRENPPSERCERRKVGGRRQVIQSQTSSLADAWELHGVVESLNSLLGLALGLLDARLDHAVLWRLPNLQSGWKGWGRKREEGEVVT